MMTTPFQEPVSEQSLWQVQPAAARLVDELLDRFCQAIPALAELRGDLLKLTGTRLVDWIDHVSLNPLADETDMAGWEQRLRDAGFTPHKNPGPSLWRHERALLPPIYLDGHQPTRIGIKVDSVVDYLAAHRLGGFVSIVGGIGSPVRRACIASEQGQEFWVVERHGSNDWEPTDVSAEQLLRMSKHFEAFRIRQRVFDNSRAGFDLAIRLIDAAVSDLDIDRTCDLFFQTERLYWQSRNRAGQLQKSRQDRLGMGWANHDHHTYRCSREYFADLVRVLESLGFQCRERFYAGEQAGWGAQVLEQPTVGIVIFADVDLSADELMGDFAHEGLQPRRELGTVGLWCKLHGEAFLEAGMHHLECQFDFDAARRQLEADGVASMDPFTNFEFLKQSFTVGEVWPVSERRLQKALADGAIDQAQAERFRRDGALGSHLEVLERNDGYKGFNQSGISDIIRKTDPRSYAAQAEN